MDQTSGWEAKTPTRWRGRHPGDPKKVSSMHLCALLRAITDDLVGF